MARARPAPPWRGLSLTGALLCSTFVQLPAQQIRLSAAAVGALHASQRTPSQTRQTAVQLIHPVLSARVAWAPELRIRATVNLEGLTLPNGELALGAWGEGFVDRRHPHAYVHELLIESATTFRCLDTSCRLGAYLGRGFVPFGSDDPMQRAPLRYPVNHHLAQILERAVFGAQIGVGPVVAEAALFNGDEPENPSQWPRIRNRFGDSWSARATIQPVAGLELSGSAARVRSPEHRPGAGADQDKIHLGVRIERPVGSGQVTAMGEWARTSELDGTFRYLSSLGELSWHQHGLGVHYRAERTDRPEEERLGPFRTARPHLENTRLGQTRWILHTVGVAASPPAWRAFGATVVGEVTHGSIASSTPSSAFSIEDTYGGRHFWSVAVAVRFRWSTTGHDMGRYGILPARVQPH